MNAAKPTLKLAASEDEPSTSSPGEPLWAGGFPLAAIARPGELPARLRVDLDEDVAAAARAAAERRGVPGRLWVRVAVEANRQLNAATKLLDIERNRLTAILDKSSATPASVVGIGDAALNAYARSLRRGGREVPALASGTTDLIVPPEWALAWTQAAWADGLTISAWIARCLASAPAHAIRWEAAAAETGRYLGEWMLWAALSNSASARAHA